MKSLRLITCPYGVGPVCATAILAELGDPRRFARSDDAVRHSGLDVTVYQSDSKRAPGHLSHEGPELLRWALFEAALSAARAGSPDHAYYRQVAGRIDHNRACLRLPASSADAPTTSCASSATRRSPPSSATGTPRRRLPLPPNHASARARLPVITQMRCGRLPQGACRQAAMARTAPKDRAAASNLSRGSHPIDHLVAGRLSVDLGKAGRPARRRLARRFAQEVTPVN